MWVISFMEERIQDWATVKRKKVYSGTYTLHNQSVGHLRRRETQIFKKLYSLLVRALKYVRLFTIVVGGTEYRRS